MGARTWDLVVRDAHRRPHRGVVLFAARPEAASAHRRAEFRIILLTRPHEVAHVPDGSAVCVPSAGVSRASIARLPDDVARWTLDAADSALYRSGRVVTSAGPTVTPETVFPARGGRPRLERLARALIEVAYAETAAAYAAVIRHELALPPGADALAGLRARLAPPRAADRPPPRAPAVARLRGALRDLASRSMPSVPLGQFADDLHFLRVFDADARWTPDAASRLLRDVGGAAHARPRRRVAAKGRALRVLPARDAR